MNIDNGVFNYDEAAAVIDYIQEVINKHDGYVNIITAHKYGEDSLKEYRHSMVRPTLVNELKGYYGEDFFYEINSTTAGEASIRIIRTKPLLQQEPEVTFTIEIKKVADNKEELLKQLEEAGEIGEHPLLEGFNRIGWVTDVYPSLEPYKEELIDYMCDYHIFENEIGERLMLQHTSNNYGLFVCEGTEEAISTLFKGKFPNVAPTKVILASDMEKYMVRVEELSPMDKLNVIITFHECYGNTILNTNDFATEFYHLVNFIHSGYLPTKLSCIEDWEDTLIDRFPKYKDILYK